MALILRSVARSDVGLVRKGNEDSGYAGPRLLAVADGMGGHAAGEVASSATIDELLHIEGGVAGRDPLDMLGTAVVAANDRIRELVTEDPEREGMGTTLTALLWTGEDIRLAHIGDSRAYLLRDGELRQLTHDHTFVQTLVDDGRITADEAGVHPARSLILKALDGKPDPEPDLEVLRVVPGDRLLVCSDGLSGVVSDETLRDTLLQQRELAGAADTLVELALRGGAPDNVTVIVADVLETDAPPAPDDTAEAYLVGAASGDRPQQPRARSRGSVMRSVFGSGSADGPVETEALRYAPRPPRRYRWFRRVTLVVVLGAIVWAGAVLASDWIRGQYYVGEHGGEVAIFRGVSQEVGPLRLSDLHVIADGLPVGALPDLYRARVTETITADNLPAAERIVADLRREACSAHAPREVSPNTTRAATTPSPSPRPTPTPTPLPTAPPGYPGLTCAAP
jgi:PPM family protein phosphatase